METAFKIVFFLAIIVFIITIIGMFLLFIKFLLLFTTEISILGVIMTSQ